MTLDATPQYAQRFLIITGMAVRIRQMYEQRRIVSGHEGGLLHFRFEADIACFHVMRE